jgi:hypothetical protein
MSEGQRQVHYRSFGARGQFLIRAVEICPKVEGLIEFAPDNFLKQLA